MKLVLNTKNKLYRNPWLMFLPFLFIYLLLVFAFPTQLEISDELRYLYYANNLINGIYSPPEIFLWNGPGYPLILTPIVALQLPDVCLTMLNAVFIYLSVVFLFLVLKKFVSFRAALIFTLFWATYLSMYICMIFILSESYTALLVTLFLLYIVKSFETSSIKYVIVSGLILGFLVLTKIILAYVILTMLAGTLLMWILRFKNMNYRKAMLVILIAFATTSPYLIYTYHLTGRFFYWGNSGGQQIYWMSTPFPGEYGDWINPFLKIKYENLGGNSNSDSILKARHQKDIIEIDHLKLKYLFTGTAEDDAFKRLAIQNITQHPAKYIQNWFSNIGRMIFGFPFSYKNESPATLITIPWNAILLTFMLLCAIPTILNWRKLFFSLRFMLIFSIVYLFGSSLVSAYPRMFNVIVPVLLFWFALIFSKSLKVNMRYKDNL